MPSIKSELASPEREMTSRKCEMASRKCEMTSPKREMTSRKREMVSLKFAIKLPASFSAFAPRPVSIPIRDETAPRGHHTFCVPSP